jgi:hypothetical protein
VTGSSIAQDASAEIAAAKFSKINFARVQGLGRFSLGWHTQLAVIARLDRAIQ